jgi:hypothetical protein
VADPITLSCVGAAVMTEGIKFLYGQAAEAVKRWRESGTARDPAKPVPTDVTPPSHVFSGELDPLEFHVEKVGPLAQHLLTLRKALADHAEGLEVVHCEDRALLEAVDSLRQAMEAVYQQRLTFLGEQRAPSGPVVEGTIDIDSVAGTATAVEATLIASGRVGGVVRATRLESGGSIHAVKVGIIGKNG